MRSVCRAAILGSAASLILASSAHAQWGRRTPPPPPTPPPPLLTWLDGQFGAVFTNCGQNVGTIRRRLRNDPFPFVPVNVADFARRASPDLRQEDGHDDLYAFSQVYNDAALTTVFGFGRLFEVGLRDDAASFVTGQDMIVRGHNCLTLVKAKMDMKGATPVFDAGAAMNASTQSQQTTTVFVRSGTLESIYFNALSGAGSSARRLDAMASVWRLQRNYYLNGGADVRPPLFILPRMRAVVFSTVTGLDQEAMLDGSARAGGSISILAGSAESSVLGVRSAHAVSQEYHLASWDRGPGFQLPGPDLVASEISQAVSLDLETPMPPPPTAVPDVIAFRLAGLPRTLCDTSLWRAVATTTPESGGSPASRPLAGTIVATDGICTFNVRTDKEIANGSDARLTVTVTSAIGPANAQSAITASRTLAVADRSARLFVTAPPERLFGGGGVVPGDPLVATFRYQFEGTGAFTVPKVLQVVPRMTCDAQEPLLLTPAPEADRKWDPEDMALELTYRLPAGAMSGRKSCVINARVSGTIVRGGRTEPYTLTLSSYSLSVPQAQP